LVRPVSIPGSSTINLATRLARIWCSSRRGAAPGEGAVTSRGTFYSISTPVRKLRNGIMDFQVFSLIRTNDIDTDVLCFQLTSNLQRLNSRVRIAHFSVYAVTRQLSPKTTSET